MLTKMLHVRLLALCSVIKYYVKLSSRFVVLLLESEQPPRCQNQHELLPGISCILTSKASALTQSMRMITHAAYAQCDFNDRHMLAIR